MSALPKSDPKRPRLSDVEQTDLIVNEMLLARLFPKHEQIEEFQRNIAVAAARKPHLHAHAEMILQQKLAGEYHLLRHPGSCERCAGRGTFVWQGRFRFCGCPVGQRMVEEGAALPETSRPTRVGNAPQRELGLRSVRSLLGDDAGGSVQ